MEKEWKSSTRQDRSFAIIEIGSNNTKTHVYENSNLTYESNVTIQFKANYYIKNQVSDVDLNKLCDVISKALEYTSNIYLFGCSIFRNLKNEELAEINSILNNKFGIEVEVVLQEDEANYTALGCYSNIDYTGNVCIFIGGGSTELVFVNNGCIVDKKYYDFGVVDITSKFPSLKDDVATNTFDEVYSYINTLLGDVNFSADVLILAGGDHLYWYNNVGYELLKNTLYNHENQKYMITTKMSDEYDRDAYITSLDRIRANSSNPKWFDGSRAMKTITNLVSHKVGAKYIIPTKINMEDGLKSKIEQER